MHGGADDLGFFAFGEDDALGAAGARAIDDILAHLASAALAADQLLLVFVEVDLTAGDARCHRRFGHRRRHPEQHARIERFGDQIIFAELDRFFAVSEQDAVGHIFMRERGEGAGGRHFHLLVDAGGVDVQCAAEDEGEAEHVVDLIDVIAAGPCR